MKCLAKLARGRIDIVNDGVDSLWVRQPAVVREVFELGQEFFKRVSSSREIWCVGCIRVVFVRVIHCDDGSREIGDEV
jgi:hypothetical protein